MSYNQGNRSRSFGERRYSEKNRSEFSDNAYDDHGKRGHQSGRYRDEVYSRRVPAGKRTYFFDVKTTRSGDDFFVTITESKRIDEDRYEKHKIFLYKEDFGKFLSALHEVLHHIKEERLPDYNFRNLPELTPLENSEGVYSDEDEY